jgi:ubiquinone/menaquinone biosynthesis C-methylase UbiE
MRSFYINQPVGSIKVLDIGAGTGIMTRLLDTEGFNVTAVEPVEGMRDQMRASLPNVTVLNGTSWSLPIESSSQDAIILAQCFHWFDDITSLQEMHRVLKPDGHLFMIWNTEARDRSEWIAKLAKYTILTLLSKRTTYFFSILGYGKNMNLLYLYITITIGKKYLILNKPRNFISCHYSINSGRLMSQLLTIAYG